MSRNVNRDLAPGETQKIEGLVVLRDWEGGREANTYCEIVQRDDGDAFLELRRYERLTRGFTDVRRVPIEGETFLALADALFAPVESDARIEAVRKAALDSGRYGTCPTCKGDGWKGCALCHGKGIAPVERIDVFLIDRERERPSSQDATDDAQPVHHEPPGLRWFSPRPRRRYPRIHMAGGATLGVRRGKARESVYAPKLEITVADGHVCAFVGLDNRPVMSTHPAVVAFFESFDEAMRRDKSRQLREQTSGD